jgi:hypothetical protein
MCKIIIFLPGNIFHSNVVQGEIERMLKQKAGMDTLRKSKIPLVFAWQRIDELLAPEIYDPGPHELCAGSLTHVLHNRLTPERSAWQAAKGAADSRWQKGNTGIDVTFYPEFAPPSDPELIPTKYFFLLAPQTVCYTHDPITGTLTPPETFPDAPAIRFGSKVGILIRHRTLIDQSNRPKRSDRKTLDPIRDQWHNYLQDPAKGADDLVRAIKGVTEQDGGVHIALGDLETPYVNKVDPNVLWSEYLEALDKAGLLSAFSPLEPHLSWFDKWAVDVQPPHRILEKWTRHDAQLDYIRRAYDDVYQASNERERWLLAIARSSDVLSAMDSKIRKQKQETPAHAAKYREEVIRLGFTCLDILAGKAPLEALAAADPLLGPRLIDILEAI